jgi:hypothetical protein
MSILTTLWFFVIENNLNLNPIFKSKTTKSTYFVLGLGVVDIAADVRVSRMGCLLDDAGNACVSVYLEKNYDFINLKTALAIQTIQTYLV